MDWFWAWHTIWDGGEGHWLAWRPWPIVATIGLCVGLLWLLWALTPISQAEAEALFDEGVMARHTKQDKCPYRKGSKRAQLWWAGYSWHHDMYGG